VLKRPRSLEDIITLCLTTAITSCALVHGEFSTWIIKTSFLF
jgi:hypothetical protein